jgi:NAD(P) transhydrogenase subunit alpha
VGPVNLAATVPHDASQMYARTLSAFLGHLIRDGRLVVEAGDQIARDTLITRGGEVVNPRLVDPPA